MAGKRKYNNGRKGASKKRKVRKSYNYVQLVKPETKYFDCGINVATTMAGTSWADSEVVCDNYINSSGAAAVYTDSCLIPTANGNGYGQVDGNKYKLKGIRVRGDLLVPVVPDAADVQQARIVRVLLVEDTMPNGTQAQGEDVLQDMGTLGENVHSFMRVANNLGKFKVHSDKTYVLNVTAAGTDGANTNSVGFVTQKFKINKMFKKPHDVTIKSGNATPTVAGTVNSNFFLLVGASGAAATVAVTMQACSRAYYCD